MPTRKPKVPEKADDKEQSERFIDAARKHETDESGKAFEKLFKNVVPSKPQLSESTEPKVDKKMSVSKK